MDNVSIIKNVTDHVIDRLSNGLKSIQDNDLCALVELVPSTFIGKGTHGSVVKFDDCDQYLVKKNVNPSDYTPEGWIRCFKHPDGIMGDITVHNDEIHEHVMTSIMKSFIDRGESVCFFHIPAFIACELANPMTPNQDQHSTISLVPKFESDFDKELSFMTPYNIDFIIACILHSIILMQRRFACVHRDLKTANVFLQKIENCKWVDKNGKKVNVKDYDTIVLDFGDNRKMYFSTSEVSHIPKIGDWSFANIYLETRGANVMSDMNEFMNRTSNNVFGIPSVYEEYYDIQFFITSMIHAIIRKGRTINDTFKLFNCLIKYFFNMNYDNLNVDHCRNASIYNMIVDKNGVKKTAEYAVEHIFSGKCDLGIYTSAPETSKNQLTIGKMVLIEHALPSSELFEPYDEDKAMEYIYRRLVVFASFANHHRDVDKKLVWSDDAIRSDVIQRLMARIVDEYNPAWIYKMNHVKMTDDKFKKIVKRILTETPVYRGISEKQPMIPSSRQANSSKRSGRPPRP